MADKNMTDREKYIASLEDGNGYCECPVLSDLFKQRRKAEGLDGKCDLLKRNIDLNHPKPEDREFLEDYRRTTEELKKEVGIYYKELSTLVDQGPLRARRHDEVKLVPIDYITPQDARALLKEESSIITIHCSNCEKQIDVAD